MNRVNAALRVASLVLLMVSQKLEVNAVIKTLLFHCFDKLRYLARNIAVCTIEKYDDIIMRIDKQRDPVRSGLIVFV
jgi:hypothetical protein